MRGWGQKVAINTGRHNTVFLQGAPTNDGNVSDNNKDDRVVKQWTVPFFWETLLTPFNRRVCKIGLSSFLLDSVSLLTHPFLMAHQAGFLESIIGAKNPLDLPSPFPRTDSPKVFPPSST